MSCRPMSGYLEMASKASQPFQQPNTAMWKLVRCTLCSCCSRDRRGHIGRYAQIYAAAFSGEPWNDSWTVEDAEVHVRELLECRQSFGLEYVIDGWSADSFSARPCCSTMAGRLRSMTWRSLRSTSGRGEDDGRGSCYINKLMLWSM